MIFQMIFLHDFSRDARHSLFMTMSITKIAGDLAAGRLTARQHLETCLAAIDCEDGKRAFITVNTDAARAEAAMRSHIEAAQRVRVRALRAQPSRDETYDGDLL